MNGLFAGGVEFGAAFAKGTIVSAVSAMILLNALALLAGSVVMVNCFQAVLLLTFR